MRHIANTVEIFHRGQRIAAHGKSARRRYHTTIDVHMPPEHLAVAKGWDPDRLRNWAADIGPHTAAVIQHLLGARKHPQQAYRTCLGGAAHGQGLRARPARSCLPPRYPECLVVFLDDVQPLVVVARWLTNLKNRL